MKSSIKLSAAFLATAFTFSTGIAHASMCSSPSNNTERAICANPQLKQIEEVISKSYYDKHAELSPMEQQEIERDQKLWQSFLKNCKTDENCIRDAFNQRLTDIQDFNQVAEKEPSDDDSEVTVADNAGEAESSPSEMTNADAGSPEKSAQKKPLTQDPSLITRFTGWLFPNKDTSSHSGQDKNVATQQAVPEKPVSEIEIATSDQATPAPTEVMPSEQTANADMGLAASGQKTTDEDVAKKEMAEIKPDTAKTGIAGQAKKVTAAKEFVPISPGKPTLPNKTALKNTDKKTHTGSKTEAGQAIANASKTAPNVAASENVSASKGDVASKTETASQETPSPSFMSKIKNFFTSSDPTTSTQSPEKDIVAKGALGTADGTNKRAGNSDLAGNDEDSTQSKTDPSSLNTAKQHKNHIGAPQQAATDNAAIAHDDVATAAPAGTGLAKKASRKSRNLRTRRNAKVRARKRTLRKAQIRRRQAKRKLTLRRAANRKSAAKRQKRSAVLKARKKQATKRKKVAAAKKKAASNRRIRFARTQKLRNKKRSRTAFALRSKNRKRVAKRAASNKRSAKVNYAFPAKSLQGNSKYIKNSCGDCSNPFKLEHHLRDYY